jgi:hypothetical protein
MYTCSETAWRALALLLCAGCFELQQVELPVRPAPLTIDDFDDGDATPTASSFAPWSCSTSPGTPRVSCDTDAEGGRGGRSETVRFQLEDPPNGSMDYPMLVIETSARLPLDLSRYDLFSFDAQLQLEPPDPDSAPQLLLRLRCDAAGTGAGPEGFWLESFVDLTAEWSAYRRSLSGFARPNYLISFSRSKCITQVEALELVVSPDLRDGQVMLATLKLDQLSLE